MSYQTWDGGRASDVGRLIPAAGPGGPPPGGRLAGAGSPAPHGHQAPGSNAASGGSLAAGGSPDVGGSLDAGGRDVSVLFREHHGELVRLAVLLVGDKPSAEDVVQDVFTRLCARDRLPGGDGSVAYVRAAVLNGCRSALRRRAIVRRFGGTHYPLASPQESAEHLAILAEDRRQVLRALAGLPRRRREVLVLRYWLGLTEAEIADVLGISPGTVKSTAARGLAALARKLGEQS